MQCPCCQVEFHAMPGDWEQAMKREPVAPRWHLVSIAFCPKCNSPIIEHAHHDRAANLVYDRKIVYPLTSKQVFVDPAVPESLKNDYVEAALVLEISAKASAALSRRILQSILSAHGYANKDLAKQVEAVINERDPDKVIPLYVRNKIDSIRNFGNFSAHEQKDVTTSDIIEVEPQEADWCLRIVSDLFEHYYVSPAADSMMRDELNQKLQQAGKPPAK